MSEVKCGLAPESLETVKQLTVGSVFRIRCQGDWPGGKDWELRADGNEFPFLLKLLRLEKVADDVMELTLASYRVGDHDLKAVQLVSSESAVLLGDLRLGVVSVQDPKEPVTEPFGARPPLALPFPWLFVAVLAAGALLALALALRPYWRRRRHARWMAEVPPVRFATPEQELYRILRMGTTLEEFNQGFRHFLARRFAIPAHRIPTGRILRELARVAPSIFERHGGLVRETLVELRRAEGLGAGITEADIEGIRVRVRKILNALDQEVARQRGRP